MATPKDTSPKASVSLSHDLHEILGRIGEALAVMECPYVVLEDGDPGNEAACFRQGLDMLEAAYTALDKALTREGNGDA